MEVITVESWEDFQSCTDELDGWAFRGQTHADWPLVSSLTRRPKQGRNIPGRNFVPNTRPVPPSV